MGLAFGVVQLSQINMTLSAAPETFEAAMSLNTMAYNTCIALGALIGGLFTDHVGVTSVVWFGIVLVALAVILRASTGRRTTPHDLTPDHRSTERDPSGSAFARRAPSRME